MLIRSAAPTADLASALRVAASALNNNTRCILPPRPGGECVWESMKAKVRLLSPAHPPPSPVVSSLPYPRLLPTLVSSPVSPFPRVSFPCATVPWAELHAVDVQPDQRLGVRQWPKNGRQDGPRLVHVPCHDRQVGPAAIRPRGHCHRCPSCHSFVNCPCCSLSLLLLPRLPCFSPPLIPAFPSRLTPSFNAARGTGTSSGSISKAWAATWKPSRGPSTNSACARYL